MSQPSTTTHNNSANAQERELVYCHECENEWYRDEHGLVCPDCRSDFTEVIEQGHDPRVEMAMEEDDHNAPDPDEDDIDHFRWAGGNNNNSAQTNPGSPQAGFPRMFTLGGGGGEQQQQQQQGQRTPAFGGGLFGILGQAIQAALQPGSPQPQSNQGDGEANRGESGEGGPNSPQPQQSQNAPGGTFIRHHHGSGANFSWSITTTSSSNILPRNANAAQPFQAHPEHLNEMMHQMIMNIGAIPTVVRINGGGMGGGVVGGGRMPINLMDILAGGRAGDAVFSQEALDRIVTQLMEQHGSGNAPPPASEQAIESLPKREITKSDLADDSGKAECSICMDECPLGTQVTVLPCKHWFHHDCIKAWLIEHDTCPHCRRGITPRDEGANRDQAREADQAPLHDMHSPEYQATSPPPTSGGGFAFPPDVSSFGQSPQQQQHSEGSRPQFGRSASSAGSIFARMRDAFGGGASSSSNSNNNNSSSNSNSGNAGGNNETGN